MFFVVLLASSTNSNYREQRLFRFSFLSFCLLADRVLLGLVASTLRSRIGAVGGGGEGVVGVVINGISAASK